MCFLVIACGWAVLCFVGLFLVLLVGFEVCSGFCVLSLIVLWGGGIGCGVRRVVILESIFCCGLWFVRGISHFVGSFWVYVLLC